MESEEVTNFIACVRNDWNISQEDVPVSQKRDRALGSVIGALVGDAAGATLEFHRREITDQKARDAMKMPGGGSLNVGPGQITDDGELTLALASVLYNKNASDFLNFEEGGEGEKIMDEIAKAYSEWYKSDPFDMGQTCGRAFGFANTAAEMRENALSGYCSEANGQLMRCTPIPVFLSLFHDSPPYKLIAEVARADAMLSHPSKACQDCAVLYSIAIAHLIHHSKDIKGAIELVESFPGISEKVKGWLEDSRKPLEEIGSGCRTNIGHVKHAFTLAFHFLRNNIGYEEAIFQTLKFGGDTDTNCAIVGGLTSLTLPSIPFYMVDPVLKFDPVTYDINNKKNGMMGYRRPALYRASNILDYFEFHPKTLDRSVENIENTTCLK